MDHLNEAVKKADELIAAWHGQDEQYVAPIATAIALESIAHALIALVEQGESGVVQGNPDPYAPDPKLGF